LGSCQTEGGADAAFYRGLTVRAAAPEAGPFARDDSAPNEPGADREDAARYFMEALKSKNPVMREAAAAELPPRLAAVNPAGEILAEAAGRVMRWTEVLPAAYEDGGPFDEAEFEAIQGRFAVARSAFAAALRHFKITQEKDPLIFLRHHETLTDLGRSFQFAGSGGDGSRLFQEWEAAIALGAFAGENGIPAPDTEDAAILRYRLLYFSGRMERQWGNVSRAIELFDAALEFAPALERRNPPGQGVPPLPGQSDACIWYILSMSLRQDGARQDGFRQNGTALDALEKYLPRVRRYTVVEDILEELARSLVAGRKWETLRAVYELIPPGADGSSRARYAYLLGRAAELGYYGNPAESGIFFRAARNDASASLYYRALAASRLGEGPLEIPGEAGEAAALRALAKNHALTRTYAFPHRAEMSFLLGFFSHGAAEFAWPWITACAGKLTIPELRALAASLQEAGRWDESLRLAAAWMERKDYALSRTDMELYHPRPFREEIETYAARAKIDPWLLYGIVRTESAFMPAIRSSSGAIGLTQLMTETAEEMAARYRRSGGGELEEPLDLVRVDTNLFLGSAYFRHLLDRLENPLVSLLAYNGGITRVRRWQRAAGDLPPDLFAETVAFRETRAYGRRVFSAAAAYAYLYYALTMEDVLSDILK
jgi:soluble lytic murein transglycosylase